MPTSISPGSAVATLSLALTPYPPNSLQLEQKEAELRRELKKYYGRDVLKAPAWSHSVQAHELRGTDFALLPFPMPRKKYVNLKKKYYFDHSDYEKQDDNEEEDEEDEKEREEKNRKEEEEKEMIQRDREVLGLLTAECSPDHPDFHGQYSFNAIRWIRSVIPHIQVA